MQSFEALKELNTVDRELIRERVYKLAELRAKGDMAGMMAYAAPDIVCKTVGWNRYPFHSTVEGYDASREFGIAVNISYENLGSDLHKVLIDGDEVAIFRTARIRNRGTGKVVDVDIWNYLRFRDGLVVEFSEYPDAVAFARLEED